ncbi:MAG: ADP-ribosylglycohydrolase family protein [Chloroflexi bacterium]|nr:ADP-ribosylglycohydrolase family protein [Chloroflexota bacterium]
MIGAIAGDIIGSAYEWHQIKSISFELFSPRSQFTDDTVLTVAVADCILNGKEYAATFREYGRRYPHAGYGGNFRVWLWSDNPKPYNSFGNGSAMRVSPVGFAFSSLDAVLREAERSAAVTHNHPEGIKGAQAVAAAIFLAGQGESKDRIRDYIEKISGYNLRRTLDEIRPSYSFDETCPGSVPESIIAFLESESYEDAVRKAVSLGGDADTMACIAGGIAQAYYGEIPAGIVKRVREILDPPLLAVVDRFERSCQLSAISHQRSDDRGRGGPKADG